MLYMVFDVESIGLHGEGYAFGWVVVDRQGKEQESCLVACQPELAAGDAAGRLWVSENTTPIVPTFLTPKAVRNSFWSAWRRWHDEGATLWAECAWPVEARFLSACVDDDPQSRCVKGPYPLHDVATLRLAAGFDPLATVKRYPDEMPIHDPAADARQSARLLIEALDELKLHE